MLLSYQFLGPSSVQVFMGVVDARSLDGQCRAEGSEMEETKRVGWQNSFPFLSGHVDAPPDNARGRLWVSNTFASVVHAMFNVHESHLKPCPFLIQRSDL